MNYNSWNDTIECLESILKLQYPNFRIVVVDNNSPNDSFIRLKEWSENKLCHYLPTAHQFRSYSIPTVEKEPPLIITDMDDLRTYESVPLITLIQSSVNGGYSAGNNIGIKFCLAQNDVQYLWILNNDTVVEETSLGSMVSSVLTGSKEGKKLGLFGNRITCYHNTDVDQVSYYHFKSSNATVEPVKTRVDEFLILEDCRSFYPCGASIFVTKDFVDEVGLMDERYFLYYEEPDWSIRASKKNYSLGIFNHVPVYHKEGASAGSSVDGKFRSSFSDYYLIKNRFTIIRKFYPANLWIVYISMLGIAVNRILRKQYDRLGLIWRIMREEYVNSKQRN